MDPWIVAIIGLQLAFAAAVFWIVTYYRLRRKDQLADERLRVMERFDSGEDFTHFLDSEPGRLFLDTFKPQPRRTRAPWLASLFIGIVALFAGLGFLLLVLFGRPEELSGLIVPAVLCLAGGAGTLLATGICFKLADRLFPPHG